MAPIILLDKSAFQAYSLYEHYALRRHFFVNTAPVLVSEVLGDLSKTSKRHPAVSAVATLAKKFGGSGGPYNLDHWMLLTQSLLGARVPMTGQCVADNSRESRAPDGSLLMLVDISPLGHAVMRWARGDFSNFDQQQSELWRKHTRNLSLSALDDVLRARKVSFSVAGTRKELGAITDEVLGIPEMQEPWLEFLLSQTSLPPAAQNRVRRRWIAQAPRSLAEFAPYAAHTLRALLALRAAVSSKLVKWDSTHLIDVTYLLYAPFCQVFVSGDRLHEILAPHLLRPDQEFVSRDELKADLKQRHAIWEALSPEARRRRDFALGSYPSPLSGSIISTLWRRYCGEWTGSGNRASRLSVEEQRLAIAEARQLFDTYLRDSGQPPGAEV